MTDRRKDELAGHESMPMGVGGLAGMTFTGDREDPGLEHGNERLQALPDHEDDHLRGTDDSVGAGVLSAGGTAKETGQSTGDDGIPGEERESEDVDEAVFPLPIVGGRVGGQ